MLSIQLEIGELTFLNPEQLKFWILEGFKKTLAEGAKLRIRRVKPHIICNQCTFRGSLKLNSDPVYHFLLPVFACPSCGSGDISLRRGRECRIRRIQILKEDEGEA